jgi:hypothetical protein
MQIQGAYRGSAPSGTANSAPLSLSLADAVKRGIQFNLGSVTAGIGRGIDWFYGTSITGACQKAAF